MINKEYAKSNLKCQEENSWKLEKVYGVSTADNDHKPKLSDSPPNFFDHAREYLGCKEGCECKKFMPSYRIDPEKVNKILEKEDIVTQTEQQEKSGSDPDG